MWSVMPAITYAPSLTWPMSTGTPSTSSVPALTYGFFSTSSSRSQWYWPGSRVVSAFQASTS